MKGDPVPDADHILRYVGGQHIEDDGTILGGAFIAKPKDNNCPSYNWLEFLEGSLEEQVQQVRNAARLTYGARALLVRINVGTVRTHIAEGADGHAVSVIHDPRCEDEKYPDPDPSHALMTNVPDENDPNGELIGDLIRQCKLDEFPARRPAGQ
jgi:hypothetical protein